LIKINAAIKPKHHWITVHNKKTLGKSGPLEINLKICFMTLINRIMIINIAAIPLNTDNSIKGSKSNWRKYIKENEMMVMNKEDDHIIKSE